MTALAGNARHQPSAGLATSRGSVPLNVCLVSSAYLPYPSGVSEHVAQLAEALSIAGHTASVITTRFDHATEGADRNKTGGGEFGDSNEPERRVALADGAVRVYRVGRAARLPGNGSYATLPVGRRLPAEVGAALAHIRPQVVHCHGFMFPEIAYWAMRASSAVNVVSLMSAGFPSSRLTALAFRTIFRGQVGRVRAVIALSRWAADCHAGFFREPYEIIPPGIDLGRFRPGLAVPGRLQEGPTVLFVGRLDNRKGVEVLVRAMPAVLAALPAARLTIVGEGPRRAPAERLASELGIAAQVRFEGLVSRDELPGHYSSASVYVSPALGGESFGIVLLEAMASGTPVVASNIRGYDEVVPAGGLLVPPGDSDHLASAILRVVSNPAEAARLSRAGLSQAAHFAWPAIAERTIRLYERALTSTSS